MLLSNKYQCGDMPRRSSPNARQRSSAATEETTHDRETRTRHNASHRGGRKLARRTARGYPNPTNYQLRMLLIAGGRDASTHTQL